MSCLSCESNNQVEFSTEMLVHRGSLKNLDKPDVGVSPTILVCLSCGSSRFTVPNAELELLASDSPNGERQTMAAAG
jgi:hypothetical protein